MVIRVPSPVAIQGSFYWCVMDDDKDVDSDLEFFGDDKGEKVCRTCDGGGRYYLDQDDQVGFPCWTCGGTGVVKFDE